MLRQRQHNVQEQNALVEKSIRGNAVSWRTKGVPEALKLSGEQKGIDWGRSIVVDLDIDFRGMPRLFGVLLSQDERFIRFEIDTDSGHRRVESIDLWEDVTAEQNLSLHNRGTGVGRGALAIKILRELNDEPQRSVPPLYPKSATALLDSRMVAATWALLVAVVASFLVVKWAGIQSLTVPQAALTLFVLAAVGHVALSFRHECPACGKHPTIQGFKPPHPKSVAQSAISGWGGVAVNVLRRRRLVCIHCGNEYRVDA
jgi:hypothetical protein